MLNLLLIFLVSQATALASSRDEAKAVLRKFTKTHDLHARLEKISASFVGRPYDVSGPLGEGPDGRYDQDPLYRFDAFDCTTYVETMLSLALARNVSGFETHMNTIRYENGVVDYLTRNHFTDLQWIPENIQNGYLREINEEIVDPSDLKVAEALTDQRGAFRAVKLPQIVVPGASVEERQRLLEQLHAEAERFSAVLTRVPYVAIAQILAGPEILDRVPTGTIVNFVRPNWDLTAQYGTRQNISHQGLLFRKRGVLYLRHATPSTKKVDEIPFIEYLKPLATHATLKGVHFMRINE